MAPTLRRIAKIVWRTKDPVEYSVERERGLMKCSVGMTRGSVDHLVETTRGPMIFFVDKGKRCNVSSDGERKHCCNVDERSRGTFAASRQGHKTHGIVWKRGGRWLGVWEQARQIDWSNEFEN